MTEEAPATWTIFLYEPQTKREVTQSAVAIGAR